MNIKEKMKTVIYFILSLTLMPTVLINCKRIEFTGDSNMALLSEKGINIADRNSLVFDIRTCADNVFMILSNTVDTRSNPSASYYTVVFSDAINMISVNCFGCQPVLYYPLTTVGPCNVTHELWVAWDPDGPLRIGQGHVVEERTFMDLKDGNVTDVFFAQVSAIKPVHWSFIVEDDALRFLTPSPDGSTIVKLGEDTSPGTTVINITTTRPDINITAEVFGNASLQYFYMDGLALKTRQPLDYETLQLHNVRLITSESVALSVKVIVTDVNDETPNVRCDETVELPEECPVGIGIAFPCVITDADHGDEHNITITGPDSDYFRVENDTQIVLARHLDRDGNKGRQSLNISLVVSDIGGHTINHSLNVDVLDVNDNYPIFSSSVYVINVTENNTVDLPVLNFTVSDKDYGSNSNITVAIHDRDANDCRFQLDSLTLTLEAGNCDFEEFELRDQTYSLTLEAHDNPSSGPVKTAVAVVVIQVQPLNEYVPFWNISGSISMGANNFTIVSSTMSHEKLPFFNESTSDSIPTHPESKETKETYATQVRSSTADIHTTMTPDSSTDIQTNETMTTDSNFQIQTEDTQTNETMTSDSKSTDMPGITTRIDNSTVSSNHVTTAYTDKGGIETNNNTSNNSNNTTVSRAKKRMSRSINSAIPAHREGRNTNYTFPIQKVPETASIGTLVYTLVAGDKDSSEHSQLVYNITQILSDKVETASEVFELNPKSGDIVTSIPLDRDDPSNSSAYYTLVVTCSDGDFTINGTLMIEVTEENEFPPVFARSVQSVDVPTSFNEPQNIANFSVTDLDLHSNISLHFLNDTEGFSLQRLNLSWGLYYNKSLNVTSRDNIPQNLVVIATDKGSPELTSSAIVIFNQAICAPPTTTTTIPSTSTTTTTTRVTSDTSVSPSRTFTQSRSPPTTRQPGCVTERNVQQEKRRQEEESELLILKIMAVTEGVIMAVLLIVTGLVFTGRLFGNKSDGDDDHSSKEKADLPTKEMMLQALSEPCNKVLEVCKEALPLQDLMEKEADQLLSTNVEKEITRDGDTENILKTTEDSGHSSCASIDDGDIRDTLKVVEEAKLD